jgi:putative ABC transport system permease protein
MNLCGYAVKELLRHRTRTMINAFGYAVAVSLMIAVLSVLHSHNLAAVSVLKSTGTHFMAFIPQPQTECEPRFETGGPFAEGVYTSMIDASSLGAIKKLPGVRDATPYLLYKVYSKESGDFLSIGGVDLASTATQTNVCAPTDIVSGRYLTSVDTDVCVVEESYARAADLHVNDSINVLDREFKIVGVVNCGIKPAKADIYAPIEVVQEVVQQVGQYPTGTMNIILVEVADARIQEDVFKSVQRALSGASISSYSCYIPARSVISIVEGAGWGISLIIAISVTLFVFRSQLASVVERTREIGILKSVGWSNSRVMGQILLESVIQALVGGVAGCAIAIVVISLLRLSNLNSGGNTTVAISYPAIAAAMTLALTAGIVAGTIPAMRAYEMQPAQALRRFAGE